MKSLPWAALGISVFGYSWASAWIATAWRQRHEHEVDRASAVPLAACFQLERPEGAPVPGRLGELFAEETEHPVAGLLRAAQHTRRLVWCLCSSRGRLPLSPASKINR